MRKFVSEFDVPVIDIGIPNSDGIATFHYQQVEFFSSVAAWKEQPEVIGLPDPVIAGGGVRRLSPNVPLVRNTINMAFLHGANQITSYLHLYPKNKDVEKSTCYTPGEYTTLNEYVGRISLLRPGAQRIQPMSREQLAAQIGDALPEQFRLKFARDGHQVSLARFVTDNRLVYYIVNRTEKPIHKQFLSGGAFKFLDPATSEIFTHTAACELVLPILGSLLLVHGE